MDLQVGDLVRIDAALALASYAISYADVPHAAATSGEERANAAEHVRKLIDFDGFEARVVNVSGMNKSYPELEPLSERPDGFGLSTFNWTLSNLVKIDD